MVHTSCRQPPPQALAADVSQGYLYSNATFVPQAGEMLTGAAPAGAMAASAADVATFMLAQLGHVNTSQPNVLSDASLSAMHARQFAHDPALPGFAFGFYESWSHGLRMIGHAGDTRWFHTNLVLVPSEDLGVFAAFNTNTAGPLSAERFFTQFFDHYYPASPVPPPVASANAADEGVRVAGEYESLRASFSTFQRAFGLAGPSATFTTHADGTLTMTWALGDVTLHRSGSMMYRNEQGSEVVVFRTDPGGRVTRAFVGSAPMLAFERIPWYRSPRLHWIIGAAAIVSFIVAVFVAAAGRAGRLRAPSPAARSRCGGRQSGRRCNDVSHVRRRDGGADVGSDSDAVRIDGGGQDRTHPAADRARSRNDVDRAGDS